MTAKTLPELTAYIESRIRAFGRDNGIIDKDSCVTMYSAMVGERPECIYRVVQGIESPSDAVLRSLIGHMGITSVYPVQKSSICNLGYTHEEDYYVVKTTSRD